MSEKLSEEFKEALEYITEAQENNNDIRLEEYYKNQVSFFNETIEKIQSLEKQLANYTKRNEKLSRLLKDQTGGVTFNELNQSK